MPFVRRKRGQVLLVHNHREEGKVRQVALHAFTSPSELSATLEEGAWEAWRRTLAWRHPDLKWPWDRIRERLVDALEEWEASPAGQAVRQDARTAAIAAELREDLAARSRSSSADLALVERIAPDLERIGGHITRLLPWTAPDPAPRAESSATDELFWAGMESWWAGDRPAALVTFRHVLSSNPHHAEAHLHLAVDLMDRGRLADAEAHLEQAVQGAEPHLEWVDGCLPWGILENRPYLRALANRALVLHRRRRWEDAAALHVDILDLDPPDHMGVRSLLCEEYHRLGRMDEALDAYAAALDDPGCRHGYALALFQSGRSGRAALELVEAFGANRYIAPMLLGRPWERLEGYWFTSAADPDWAMEYVSACGDLWRGEPGAAAWLEGWWSARPVQAWLEEVAANALRLDQSAGEERQGASIAWSELRSEATIRRVVEAVEPGAADVPSEPRVRMRTFDLADVSIDWEGTTAVITPVEGGGGVHLVLDEARAALSDEEVLDIHNDGVEACQAMAAIYEHVALEIPPGRPQTERGGLGRMHMRGDVLRAEIDSADEGVELVVDGRPVTMQQLGELLEMYTGWGLRLTIVPTDRLAESPAVRVAEPDLEVH